VVLLIVHFLLLFIQGGQVIPITKENLKKAFATEKQSNPKYQALQKKAEHNEFKSIVNTRLLQQSKARI
jgi:rubrerythrin